MPQPCGQQSGFLDRYLGQHDEPNKLPLVKDSLRNLVNELRDKDRVAIVVYAGAAGMVLDSTPASDKSKILRSINQMQSGAAPTVVKGFSWHTILLANTSSKRETIACCCVVTVT